MKRTMLGPGGLSGFFFRAVILGILLSYARPGAALYPDIMIAAGIAEVIWWVAQWVTPRLKWPDLDDDSFE